MAGTTQQIWRPPYEQMTALCLLCGTQVTQEYFFQINMYNLPQFEVVAVASSTKNGAAAARLKCQLLQVDNESTLIARL